MGVTAAEKLLAWNNCPVKKQTNKTFKTFCPWEGHRAPSINPLESFLPPGQGAVPYPTSSSGTKKSQFQDKESQHSPEDKWHSDTVTQGHLQIQIDFFQPKRVTRREMLMLRNCIKTIKNVHPLGSCQYVWAKIKLLQSLCSALNTLLVFQANILGPGRDFYLQIPFTQYPQSWLLSSAPCAVTPPHTLPRSSPACSFAPFNICHGFFALPCANPLFLWCSFAAPACAVKSPSTQNCSP